jgi:hypothetical protein
MQFFVESRGDPDLEDDLRAENQQVDSAALRILAAWIAQRAGFDRGLGAPIERSFVVAQAPA